MEDFYTQPAAVRHNANRTATRLDAASALHREIGARMLERLDYIKLAPQRVLDLGCANGGALPGLAQRFPAASLLALDFAQRRVARAAPKRSGFGRGLDQLTGKGARLGICANMQALPLTNESVNLVWSNLALHWLNDPAPAITEAWRVLAPGGLLMFATLGPDTLTELRQAMPQRVHRFIDLHDIGDLLVGTRFATPVMDMERITLTYSTPEALQRELHDSGSANAMFGRARGLAGRASHAQALERLCVQRNAEGRISASFEVIYGHAWKPAVQAPQGQRAEQPIRWMSKQP